MSTRRSFLRHGAALLAGSTMAGCAGASRWTGLEPPDSTAVPPGGVLARPTEAQRRWQDAEIGVLFHLDLPVVAGDHPPDDASRERIDPRRYDPRELDTDQWIDAAKAAGAKYAVFTASHASGFMQWQSGLYPYGCRESAWRGGNGDVVADFVASCRRAGILPGLFLSSRRNVFHGVWDHFTEWGRGRGTEAQAVYNRHVESQTEELCSRYGDLVQIWYDAGVITPEQGGPDVLPIFERLQPDSVFYHSASRSDHRRITHEAGHAGTPRWASMPGRDAGELSEYGEAWKPHLQSGDPTGTIWSPGMLEVALRGKGASDRFWRPDSESAIFEVSDLLERYYGSVGRNANLVISTVVDHRGLVPEPDARRLAEFGRELRRRFDRPIAETAGSDLRLELEIRAGAAIDHVILMEDVRYGERIRRFRVEVMAPGGRWRPVVRGRSVGHKWIWPSDVLVTDRIQLVVEEATAIPVIRNFSVYGG